MKYTKSPAGAGLLVVIVTVLGWIGCDGLSRVADKTAEMLIASRPSSAEIAALESFPAAPAAAGTAATTNPVGDWANAAGKTTDPAGGVRPIATNVSQRSENLAVNFRPYLTIATYNIQAFGKAKVADRNVLNYLVDIVRQFDVVAIQEIRDPEQVALPYFVEALNAQGARYRYLVGPREGPVGNQEQIAYVFNSDLVMPTGTEFVARDLNQRMQRNPYVVGFQCRRVDSRAPFTFTLVSVSIQPEAADLELEAVADLLPMIRRSSTEDDLILLGSFHTPPDKAGRLSQLPNTTILIPPTVPTNTAKTACWDNLGFDRLATTEFTQQYGLFDVAAHYRLTPDQAALLSDHLPVWATFSIYESSPNFALQSSAGVR